MSLFTLPESTQISPAWCCLNMEDRNISVVTPNTTLGQLYSVMLLDFAFARPLAFPTAAENERHRVEEWFYSMGSKGVLQRRVAFSMERRVGTSGMA